MRKLATVQRIKEVCPIEGTDSIELVKVLGWQCVAKKGQFKAGDDCVYFEIDSLLPVKPEFEFLRGNSYKNSDLLGEGFRLRTMKFRGQISQGLVLPIDIVEEKGWHGLPEGTDVTELLEVRKWEIPEMATDGGTVIGSLPHSIPYTDETRIQAEPELLQEFAGLPYYISTKMDGLSHSISLDENGFHVTGHNYEYKNDGKSWFYELVKTRNFKEKLKSNLPEIEHIIHEPIQSISLQGEYCGEGIQKNRLRLKKPEWYVFTVNANGKRLNLRDSQKIAGMIGEAFVPIEERGEDLPSKYPTIEALLERADGQYLNGGKKEGIVIRPTEPVFSKTLSGPLSMQVVNNKYLLKND